MQQSVKFGKIEATNDMTPILKQNSCKAIHRKRASVEITYCSNNRSTNTTKRWRTNTRKRRILPIERHSGGWEQWVQMTFTVSKDRIPFCWKRNIRKHASLWSGMQQWLVRPGLCLTVLLWERCIVLEQQRKHIIM